MPVTTENNRGRGTQMQQQQWPPPLASGIPVGQAGGRAYAHPTLAHKPLVPSIPQGPRSRSSSVSSSAAPSPWTSPENSGAGGSTARSPDGEPPAGLSVWIRAFYHGQFKTLRVNQAKSARVEDVRVQLQRLFQPPNPRMPEFKLQYMDGNVRCHLASEEDWLAALRTYKRGDRAHLQVNCIQIGESELDDDGFGVASETIVPERTPFTEEPAAQVVESAVILPVPSDEPPTPAEPADPPSPNEETPAAPVALVDEYLRRASLTPLPSSPPEDETSESLSNLMPEADVGKDLTPAEPEQPKSSPKVQEDQQVTEPVPELPSSVQKTELTLSEEHLAALDLDFVEYVPLPNFSLQNRDAEISTPERPLQSASTDIQVQVGHGAHEMADCAVQTDEPVNSDVIGVNRDVDDADNVVGRDIDRDFGRDLDRGVGMDAAVHPIESENGDEYGDDRPPFFDSSATVVAKSPLQPSPPRRPLRPFQPSQDWDKSTRVQGLRDPELESKLSLVDDRRLPAEDEPERPRQRKNDLSPRTSVIHRDPSTQLPPDSLPTKEAQLTPLRIPPPVLKSSPKTSPTLSPGDVPKSVLKSPKRVTFSVEERKPKGHELLPPLSYPRQVSPIEEEEQQFGDDEENYAGDPHDCSLTPLQPGDEFAEYVSFEDKGLGPPSLHDSGVSVPAFIPTPMVPPPPIFVPVPYVLVPTTILPSMYGTLPPIASVPSTPAPREELERVPFPPRPHSMLDYRQLEHAKWVVQTVGNLPERTAVPGGPERAQISSLEELPIPRTRRSTADMAAGPTAPTTKLKQLQARPARGSYYGQYLHHRPRVRQAT